MLYAAKERKERGAYYTDRPVADLIARWAVRSGDRVLDPSCGDGVFLHAAYTNPVDRPGRIVGVELSERQAAETRSLFRDSDLVEVTTSDFFDFEGGPFDAVIGNPPFIRYHSFNGPSREKALFRCARGGVKLSRLASSWAPFLICASEMLAPGGRLGFVLPTELLHAGYAKPVLQYLNVTFDSVIILTFKERLFPDLAQNALILLASGKGRSCNALLHVEAENIEAATDPGFETFGKAVDPQPYLSGAKRMKEALVDARSTEILEALLRQGLAYRLGARMHTDIGYVTGANQFFHLSDSEARRRRIPHRFLSPTVYRGGSLSGLAYSINDWTVGSTDGSSGYLLRIPRTAKLPAAVQSYLAEGAANGFSDRYKCRVRDPWYSVPHVHWPQAFLTSMSGERPAIVVNDANVFASNSLHVLRPVSEGCDVREVATSWLSSVTSLSIEIEGHALGGGMLKLEPTEAERVIVVDLGAAFSAADFRRIDRLVRKSLLQDASAEVDCRVADVTGLSMRDLARLRQSALDLRQRRFKRSK